MAEVQKKGWEGCYHQYTGELQKAERQIEYQLKAYRKLKWHNHLSGKARTMRRTIKRLNARRRAVYDTCNKISVLSGIYMAPPEKPFSHLIEWGHTKRFWKSRFKSRKFLGPD